MKLLMIYTDYFSVTPNIKTLEDAEDVSGSIEYKDSLIGLIHVEEEDEEKAGNVETKLVKNLKWAARKNDTNRIVLHSFAHLSESNASPDFAKMIFDNTESRLINADYEVSQTPFGYFHHLELKAPGYSLARLFKSF